MLLHRPVSVRGTLKVRNDGSVTPRKERIPAVCHMNHSRPFPPHQKCRRPTSRWLNSLHRGRASTGIGSKLSILYLPVSCTNPQDIAYLDSKWSSTLSSKKRLSPPPGFLMRLASTRRV